MNGWYGFLIFLLLVTLAIAIAALVLAVQNGGGTGHHSGSSSSASHTGSWSSHYEEAFVTLTPPVLFDTTPGDVTVTSGLTPLQMHLVRVGKEVTLQIPAFTFNDTAITPTAALTALNIIPAQFRPSALTDVEAYLMTRVSSVGAIQAGRLNIASTGTLFWITDQAGTTPWAASGNLSGGVSASYTIY